MIGHYILHCRCFPFKRCILQDGTNWQGYCGIIWRTHIGTFSCFLFLSTMKKLDLHLCLYLFLFINQGRAHKDRSDFEGPWTKDFLKFDNSYFVWEWQKKTSPHFILYAFNFLLLVDKKSSHPNVILFRELLKNDSRSGDQLLKLPTDKALVTDSQFSQYVREYAKVNFCYYDFII